MVIVVLVVGATIRYVKKRKLSGELGRDASLYEATSLNAWMNSPTAKEEVKKNETENQ